MNARKRIMAASLGLAGVVLPLAAAGTAHADEENTYEGFNGGTQSPLQAVSAVGGTLGEANAMFLDAANGDNRPDGANGVESEFPPPNPELVTAPFGGLLKNGPFA